MKISQRLERNLCCVTMACWKIWDKSNSRVDSIKIRFFLFTQIQITTSHNINTSQIFLMIWPTLPSTTTSILKMLSLSRLETLVLSVGLNPSIDSSLRKITSKRQWGLLFYCLITVKKSFMEISKNTSQINLPYPARLF
jgi:hypothetical protein